MHIHLFISDRAPEGDRLRTVLQDAMPEIQLSQYPSIGSIGWMTPTTCNGLTIAVIMAAKNEELVMLAIWKSIWGRIKTILVLPNDEPETITLGHALRPRYVTFTDRDFHDVVAVLKHIKGSPNKDIYN